MLNNQILNGGGFGGGVANLSEGTKTTTTIDVNSDTGTNATLSSASTTEAGVLSSVDKIKINNVSKYVNGVYNGISSGDITAGSPNFFQIPPLLSTETVRKYNLFASAQSGGDVSIYLPIGAPVGTKILIQQTETVVGKPNVAINPSETGVALSGSSRLVNSTFIDIDGKGAEIELFKSSATLWNVTDISLPILQNNYTATVDPTATDDNTENYSIGSEWLNTTTQEAFICTSNSSTAAVWKSITATGGGGGITEYASSCPTSQLGLGTQRKMPLFNTISTAGITIDEVNDNIIIPAGTWYINVSGSVTPVTNVKRFELRDNTTVITSARTDANATDQYDVFSITAIYTNTTQGLINVEASSLAWRSAMMSIFKLA